MTSRRCFVHIVLPGDTEFVTAGKFEHDENAHAVPTGRFVYGRNYMQKENAVPIDPVELKLTSETFQTGRLKGVFGALRDASPDYWGRRTIERSLGSTSLGEMDYLLHSPDDRAGALGFSEDKDPPPAKREFNRATGLGELQKICDAIIAGEELPDDPDTRKARQLVDEDTGTGGARPKTVIEDHDALWIAKFNRTDDRWNHARVEHAMLELARVCGLQASESRVERVGSRDVLLVRRFDRKKTANGYLRARMLSALTLLRAEDSHQDRDKWSYVFLAEALRRISAQPQEDAPKLFRRMCFNALISNNDDHPRNHAVIAMNDDWKLSPVYDLDPGTPVSIGHRNLALACGDMGRRAHADNLLSQSARFLLEPEQATRIIDDMEQAVTTRWEEIARGAGVSQKDRETIRPAFAYPGFRLPLDAAGG